MVFAHQGGWDEILFILGPILVVVVLLRLAKRRVDAMAPPTAPGAPDGNGATGATADTSPAGDVPRSGPVGDREVSEADDARSRRPPS